MTDPTQPQPDSPSTEPLHIPSRHGGFWASRWFSFRAALSGARHVIRHERNAWIELVAGAVVAVAAWRFRISPLEWGLLGVVVFLMLALEAVNTAVEATIDLVSPQYHPLAKIAKDAAAGALLFGVLASLCVAAAVFGPRLWALFSSALAPR